ncbi:ogr/Delta-like zinc finger family protein [Lysobacter enzymogenes]|uniref:ogr/Delta-like zinc finger family protein n=1 Tax=Lysobacter enzymogenes TaxID=69 RepID=UPI00384C2723
MAAFSQRKRVVFTCDACGSVLIKRTSYLSHQHLRHDAYVCDNPMCGASYTGHTELTGIASPSGLPNARPSDLPESPSYARNLALKAYREGLADGQLDLLDSLPATADH